MKVINIFWIGLLLLNCQSKTPKLPLEYRLVSLSPSTTELLFSLRLDSHIVAVTSNCNYPPEARKKKSIGDFNPSLEKILIAKPTLVVGDQGMNAKVLQTLAKMQVPTLAIKEGGWWQVQNNLRLLGDRLHRSAAAESVCRWMDSIKLLVENKKTSSPKPKVFLEHYEGLFTTGGGTFLNELIESAGGINIAGDLTGWVQINEERVLNANPDCILLTASWDSLSQKWVSPIEPLLRKRKAWTNVNALRKNKIILIPQDWISRPGPRLALGMQAIAKALASNSFEEKREKP